MPSTAAARMARGGPRYLGAYAEAVRRWRRDEARATLGARGRQEAVAPARGLPAARRASAVGGVESAGSSWPRRARRRATSRTPKMRCATTGSPASVLDHYMLEARFDLRGVAGRALRRADEEEADGPVVLAQGLRRRALDASAREGPPVAARHRRGRVRSHGRGRSCPLARAGGPVLAPEPAEAPRLRRCSALGSPLVVRSLLTGARAAPRDTCRRRPVAWMALAGWAGRDAARGLGGGGRPPRRLAACVAGGRSSERPAPGPRPQVEVPRGRAARARADVTAAGRRVERGGARTGLAEWSSRASRSRSRWAAIRDSVSATTPDRRLTGPPRSGATASPSSRRARLATTATSSAGCTGLASGSGSRRGGPARGPRSAVGAERRRGHAPARGRRAASAPCWMSEKPVSPSISTSLRARRARSGRGRASASPGRGRRRGPPPRMVRGRALTTSRTSSPSSTTSTRDAACTAPRASAGKARPRPPRSRPARRPGAARGRARAG